MLKAFIITCFARSVFQTIKLSGYRYYIAENPIVRLQSLYKLQH